MPTIDATFTITLSKEEALDLERFLSNLYNTSGYTSNVEALNIALTDTLR